MPTPPLPDSLALEAVNTVERFHGSNIEAAKFLKLAICTLRSRIVIAKRRGIGTTNQQLEVKQGWSPEHDLNNSVPHPMVLRGTSTLYGEDGKPRLQWVKTKLDDSKVEDAMATVIKTLAESVKGLSPVIAKPKHKDKDLLCAYVLGDPHFGMYAWAQESGDDFDTDIARNITIKAVDRLVASAPPAGTAILLSVGDTLHTDNQSNTTEKGTTQDSDTRFNKVLGVAINTFRHLVLRLLQKHENVVVRFVKGNHDTHSHMALGFALQGYFSNNKRVTVDTSPADFWYYKFGKVLIGSTHGDKCKQDHLLGIMVSDQPKAIGETDHRYWYTGHIHHQVVKEYAGVTCESFQTLAPKDAWHSGKGYRSQRSMSCIVHDINHGEIDRHRCGISMIGEKK
jgi:hypothetical protein